MKNVESVGQYCKSKSIPYLGLEYTFVKDNFTNVPFNKKHAQLQVDILEKTGEWISDAEIAKKMCPKKNDPPKSQ